jgi:YgiT-type zinc finger domain-containing protein
MFYGLNRQCWKCRMYLPSSEMQQYRGQWTCPICIQDMRSEERRSRDYGRGKERFRVLAVPEYCERCGRDLTTVYILNGKKLCSSCVSAEQENWGLVGGGPSGAKQRISVTPIKAKKKEALIVVMFNELLARVGLKKREVEIVAVEPKMPIRHAKPMSEGRAKKRVKSRRPRQKA